ncbi:hypothetical protein AABB02_00395 [Streptomyces rimosus]|uniref:hypothetical protein n=1 Tax=Streptomyces rimosus TaxID=1927 RepID=UPI0031DB8097
MKLRRALSVSAATAALLPMAMAAAPASQAAPAADLPKCSDVGDPNGGNAFAGRSFGVPASVTLGADWTTYTATLTNASAKEMKSFELSGKVLSYVYNEGERDLSPYSDLQYWDTTQHAWKTLKDANGKARGTIPAPRTLKPRESVHVKLRFRVHKDLPMDHAYDAFTGITGSFVSRYNGTDCTVNGDAGGSFYPREG